jgi:5'-nucleotidase
MSNPIKGTGSGQRSTRLRVLVGATAVALAVAAASFADSTASAGRGGNSNPPGQPDPPGQLIDLQVLGFNDYHGHVTDDTSGFISYPDAAGGGEYLSAKLNELREGNKNSLTVAAGDLIGGSPAFSGLFHDEPSVESLNAMQLDVSGVGNHEFDEGVTELLRMQDGGCHPEDGCYFPDDPYAGADFQWLAANVVDEGGETPLPPYWIERVNNVKVGFIGMTLEATDTLVAAAGIAGYDFLDEAETANALVPELQAQGVQAIVVLLHEGGSQTPPPGEVDACVGISGPIVAINDALDPAIDAMITGHTHLPYNCVLDDSAGHPRIVTSAYSFGRVVTEVNLVLDKRTKDVRRDLSSATNHAVVQSEITPDPAITTIVEKWQPLFDEVGLEVVGSASGDITRGGTPPGSDRGVESAAGNLVADAQLWATSVKAPNEAKIAFMNPGGVRSDLAAGEITFGDAFTFQPFNNILYTVPMTGAEIMGVLEDQCQPAGSSRPFLHLGVSDGFTYDLATTFDAGSGDCTSVTISNMMLNSSSVDLFASYGVTMNGFLADGGDNFDTFATIDPFLRIDGGIDIDALVDYLGAFSPVAPPLTDRANELP